MSNNSYIQEQLRKLGDYTGDGDVLGPNDMVIAKNIITDSEYNNLKTQRLALLLYGTMDENERDENNRFEKIISDAAKLKSGNLLAVDCDLSQGCKGISIIEGSDSIEGSGLDNNFLKIINVRQPNDKYKIYFLGNEIVELLIEFNANNPSITYSDKFNKIFENLISSDNLDIEILKDLKAIKQYDNKLYIARLSNIDKNTFGRNEPDSDWNLQEVQELENHLLLESSEPITSINKIRFGSDVQDELLGLLDSNDINPYYISTEIIENIDLQ